MEPQDEPSPGDRPGKLQQSSHRPPAGGRLAGLGAQFMRHPIRTVGFVLRRILEIPKRGLPRLPNYSADEFDLKHGVDTAAVVQIVATSSPNARYGHRYETSPEALIRWCVEQCPTPYEETTFLDYGAGKGRALIVAAGYPFKRILGVEYSPELAAICRSNLAVLRLEGRVEVNLADAAHFEVPAGPVLALAYNPFGEPVYRQVLDRLAEAPGPVALVHVGPGHDLLQASPLASLIVAGPQMARAYAIKPADPEAAGPLEDRRFAQP